MALKLYQKILMAAIIIIGVVVVFIPSVLAEPNLQSVPTIPLMMFAFALLLYFRLKKRRRYFYVAVATFVLVVAYTGFWAYAYKMPLSQLEISIQIYQVTTGTQEQDPMQRGDFCDISFNITIRNPTGVDTPPFTVENIEYYLNNLKLKSETYPKWGHRGGTLDGHGNWYFDTHIVVKAHQTVTMQSLTNVPQSITVYSHYTETEGGDFQNIWESLVNKHITLTMKGSFTSRPDLLIGKNSAWSLRILATSPFSATQEYSGS